MRGDGRRENATSGALGAPPFQGSPCADLVEPRSTEPSRVREKGGGGAGPEGRGSERSKAGLAAHSPTPSDRKHPGGAGGGGGGGCGGARGDVRGGAARAGGGGSVSRARVEDGRCELLGAVSLPAASPLLCRRASESPRVPGVSRPPRSLRGLWPVSPARSLPPPRPRGAFRWAESRSLPPAPR